MEAATTSGSGFWSLAGAEPDRIALVEASGRAWMAGELLASANRIVHALRALGVRAGDTVAAVLPNAVEAFEVYLAATQAGWYLVPVNFHSVAPEIAYILEDSGAKAFVAHERFGDAAAAAFAQLARSDCRPVAAGTIAGFLSLAELKAQASPELPLDRQAGLVMNYTSGTTGRPKGVRRTLPGVSPEEVDWGGPLRSYGIGRESHVHLCCTPWYHTAPLIFAGSAIQLGHRVVVMERFDAESALELIERYRVTYSLMVPTQFVRLLALPEETRRRYDVSSLRLAIHGAAPCAPDVKRRMIDWWGPIVTEYYAATEGAGTIASAEEWLRKPGTVGRPIAGADVAIRDADGEPLPPGEVGYVYIKPATGAFDYFNDAQKTAGSWRGDYFTVYDIGYLDEDGYLFLCDRAAETIISGGVNIYPAEVEGVLAAHPKVADVAVFGIPNDEWGEEVKAAVQPAPGVEPSEELAAELLEHCQGRLARFKIPKSVDFVEQMPRDPNGKLYRRKLREPYWAGRERAI
jgi:long-chain acyl-CoA synthetase